MEAPPRHRSGRRGRVRHPVRLVVGLFAVVLIGLGGWLVRDVLTIRTQLTAAAADISHLQDQATSGDVDAARATVAGVQHRAGAAAAAAGDLPVRLAAHLPVLGDDVQAVRTLATVVEGLATNAMPGLVDALTAVDLGTLIRADGSIDVAGPQSAAPAVVRADAAVADAVAQVAALDPGAYVAPVADAVTTLGDRLDTVAAPLDTAARALQLLPAMLGADGPRTYLLLVQNNAEARALGGIPGAMAVLRAQDGHVEITDHLNARDLNGGPRADPVLPLTTEEINLFGRDLGRYSQDVTFTPDFPRAAELTHAMWGQTRTGPLDGVVSVDPLALAQVLGATGPVTLADGTELTADNAGSVLLNEVYFRIENPALQDVFFADAASAVFSQLLAPGRDGSALLDALARSAGQGRVLVWSAHPEEEALLSGTTVAGELAGVRAGLGGAGGDRPVVGVFLNDGSAAKMSYYLDTTAGLDSVTCRADRTQELHLRLTLTSTAPAGGEGLPAYVRGDVLTPGDVQTNVLVYAPAGGLVDTVQVDGLPASVASVRHDDLAAVETTVLLSPGQTATLDVDLVSGAGQDGDPVLRMTPGAREGDKQVSSSVCASQS